MQASASNLPTFPSLPVSTLTEQRLKAFLPPLSVFDSLAGQVMVMFPQNKSH